MSQKPVYVQFKNMEDLVRFVAFSPTPFIQHIEIKEKHIYFIHALSLGGSVIYFVELNEKINKRYVVFNRFRDEISFSDQLGSDGQSAYIPILELEKTNIFPIQ
jgi:hypothetical protein